MKEAVLQDKEKTESKVKQKQKNVNNQIKSQK